MRISPLHVQKVRHRGLELQYGGIPVGRWKKSSEGRMVKRRFVLYVRDLWLILTRSKT